MNKFFVSLGLFIVFSILSFSFYIFTFLISKDFLLKETKLSLEHQSQLMIFNINGDELQKLVQSGSDGDLLYQKLIEPISKAHSQIKDQIRYVYTVHIKNGEIIFGLDTAPKGIVDQEGQIEHSNLGDKYTDAPQTLKDALSKKMTMTSEESYTDQWGTFISSFTPIQNSKGEFVGVLGMDISLDRYLSAVNNLKRNLIVSLFTIEVMIFLLSVMIYLFINSKEREKRMLAENKEQELALIQSAKLAEIGMITASISHEINTPLSVISLHAMSIKGSKSLETAQKSALKIEKSVERINILIKSMKNYVRKSKEMMELVSFDTILNDSLSLIANFIIDVNLTKPSSIDVVLKCYPNQISQVFTNLILNSYEAIKGSENPWIKIETKQENNKLIIFVIDSGSGIPEEVWKKIELGFFSTKDQGKGSGLGLMICRKIVENHQGQFTYLHNEINTTFKIEFPIPAVERKIQND